MKVYETFQDSKSESPHLGTKPFPQPRMVVCVGAFTKSVTNPSLVLWPGVEGRVLEGAEADVSVVSAHKDIRKVGTHLTFAGTFESTKSKPTFWGNNYEWVPIAVVEVWGELSKRRPGVQKNYDGFVFSDVYEAGTPNMQWNGQCWGNATFSANPIPSPWPEPTK